MRTKHPRVIAATLVAMLVTLSASIAAAQDYPTKSILLIAPWPAGGAIDSISRLLASKLAERLGKPVVVENRPGAGSTIGTAQGAKATPDGHTLVVAGSGSLAIGPTFYKRLPYDPATDFEHIALVCRVPFVLVVNKALPIRSVPELVTFAKAEPDKLFFGSGGPGSPHHLLAEMLKSALGIEMSHVPYKGSAPALTDLVGGHIGLLFSDTLPSLPQIKAGNVVALGVSTVKRITVAPDIPALAEVGVPGFDGAGWGLVAAAAGTPKAIVTRLNAEFVEIMRAPDAERDVIKVGMVPVVSPPAPELARFVAAEAERWGKVVRAAGLAATE